MYKMRNDDIHSSCRVQNLVFRGDLQSAAASRLPNQISKTGSGTAAARGNRMYRNSGRNVINKVTFRLHNFLTLPFMIYLRMLLVHTKPLEISVT